jgi:SOS-response transcriptional repressor LexA/DNA-binding Xre family transcriptional regulator
MIMNEIVHTLGNVLQPMNLSVQKSGVRRAISRRTLASVATVGEKLDAIRRQKGVQQKWLADKLGVKPQVLNRFLKGRVPNAKFDFVARVALLLDVQLNELFSAAGLVDLAPGRPSESVIAEPRVAYGEKYQRFEIPPEEFIVGDFDYPQTYRGGETELLGGAAAGAFEDIDVSGETAEVLNPTLRDVQSGRYGVVKVSGDSMEPKLHDGDLVLLDTYEKTPKPKRIMAVYARGQGSAFGYVHKVGELTLLTKANPAYPPLLLPDDVIIRGTVKKRLSEDLE